MKKASLAILLSAIIFSGVFTCNSVQAVTTNSTNNTKVIAMRGTYHRTLRKGSTGDDVKFIQEKLLMNGFYSGRSFVDDYATVIDGIFGAETEAAVKKMQHWAGIPDDGIVGPQTWAVFDRYFQE